MKIRFLPTAQKYLGLLVKGKLSSDPGQMGMFSANPNLTLQPSKKNPNVKRWQSTGQQETEKRRGGEGEKKDDINWLKEAVDSLLNSLDYYVNERGLSIEEAKAQIKKESTAGSKAWKIALDKFVFSPEKGKYIAEKELKKRNEPKYQTERTKWGDQLTFGRLAMPTSRKYENKADTSEHTPLFQQKKKDKEQLSFNLKDDNKLQLEIMQRAGIPEEEIPDYALSSVADGKILRTYLNEVKQGEITVDEAVKRVKRDYEKMKSGEKEGQFVEPEKQKTEVGSQKSEENINEFEKNPSYKKVKETINSFNDYKTIHEEFSDIIWSDIRKNLSYGEINKLYELVDQREKELIDNIPSQEKQRIINDIRKYLDATPIGHYYDKRLYKKLNEHNIELEQYWKWSDEFPRTETNKEDKSDLPSGETVKEPSEKAVTEKPDPRYADTKEWASWIKTAPKDDVSFPDFKRALTSEWTNKNKSYINYYFDGNLLGTFESNINNSGIRRFYNEWVEGKKDLPNNDKQNEIKTEKQPYEMTKDEYLEESPKLYNELGSELFANSDFYRYSSEAPFRLQQEAKNKYPNKTAEQNHYLSVRRALEEGKKVPEEVLKDYPELAKKDLSKDDTISKSGLRMGGRLRKSQLNIFGGETKEGMTKPGKGGLLIAKKNPSGHGGHWEYQDKRENEKEKNSKGGVEGKVINAQKAYDLLSDKLGNKVSISDETDEQIDEGKFRLINENRDGSLSLFLQTENEGEQIIKVSPAQAMLIKDDRLHVKFRDKTLSIHLNERAKPGLKMGGKQESQFDKIINPTKRLQVA